MGDEAIDVVQEPEGGPGESVRPVSGLPTPEAPSPEPIAPEEVVREIKQRSVGPDMEVMTLFHGTASKNLPGIFDRGLDEGTYLTDDPQEAFKYAEKKCSEVGGRAVVTCMSLAETMFPHLGPDETLWDGKGQHPESVPDWARSLADTKSMQCQSSIPMESIDSVSFGGSDDWTWYPLSEFIAMLKDTGEFPPPKPGDVMPSTEKKPVYSRRTRQMDVNWWKDQMMDPAHREVVRSTIEESNLSVEDMARSFATAILSAGKRTSASFTGKQLAVACAAVEEYLDAVDENEHDTVTARYEAELPGSDHITVLEVFGTLYDDLMGGIRISSLRVVDMEDGVEIPRDEWPFSSREAKDLLLARNGLDEGDLETACEDEDDEDMLWDVVEESEDRASRRSTMDEEDWEDADDEDWN